MTGTTLGSYEILEPLGAGGMGEVYRARDTELDRDVALKILPPSFAGDPDRLMRFEREAKTLASLNHAHIAQVYGVETSGATRALVMELVEGEDLSARIARGPIPLEEALPMARQIAAALEAAHEQGIIHRDLKPANIKVGADDTVKVLDFGLAKAVEPVTTASSGDLANSPTLAMSAMTQHGVILGTAAYMAPEQARGKPIDKRADIFAFGVVLYEMVTGRRLFEGEDLTETLASVVKEVPDLDAAPPSLRRLLGRCLEKDPKRRLRDIGDVWDLLQEHEVAASVEPRSLGWPAWALGAAALTVAALAGAGLYAFWQRGPTAESPQFRFRIDAPEGMVLDSSYAVSPDGRYVVFSAWSETERSAESLWLRPLDALEARRLPGTEGAIGPVWSPDSRSLVFAVGDALRRVDVAGGASQTMCDPCAGDGLRLSPQDWSPEGVILFDWGTGTASGIARISASGGTPERVVSAPETGAEFYREARLLPGGRKFLYASGRWVEDSDVDVTAGLYAGSLDDPTERVRVLDVIDPFGAFAYVASPEGGGFLLWVRQGTLMAQPFDAEAMRRIGEPTALIDDVYDSQFRVSDSGVLVYSVGAVQREVLPLIWLDRHGQQVGALGDLDFYGELALSRDGAHVIVWGDPPAVDRIAAARRTVASDERIDLWVFDVDRGSRVPLAGGVRGSYPVWSPDGREVLFSKRGRGSLVSGDDGVIRSSIGVTAVGEVILANRAEGDERTTFSPLDWSPDGRHALVLRRTDGGRGFLDVDIVTLPLEGDEPQPIDYMVTRFREGSARFSPDGRWVVYVSDASGAPEVYVSPFPDAAAAPAATISVGGGSQPRWRPDGEAVLYVSADRQIMEVSLAARPGPRLEPAAPVPLLTLPSSFRDHGDLSGWYWDMTPDGERFLIRLFSSGAPPPLTVEWDWRARLARRP